jgi:FdhE protein
VKDAPTDPDAVSTSFERRRARAKLLAESAEAARAPLAFGAGLYAAQASAAALVSTAHRRHALSGVLDRDVPRLAEGFRGVLRFAASSAPPDLAEIARARAAENDEAFMARLGSAWSGDTDGRSDYLSRAALRPYLEVLAAVKVRPDRAARAPGATGCPFCAGPPWIAARRAETGTDGAQRFFGCALCGTDWPGGRLRCPACGEDHPDKLPSFQTDRHPTARIEACESCRRYVKSLDLTLDGRLIPEVDDLVSVSMDLWAAEQGFTRIEPGLAGI